MKRKLDMSGSLRGSEPSAGVRFPRRAVTSARCSFLRTSKPSSAYRRAVGGRRIPRWTERRLVPLALETLERLEDITARVRKHGGINVEPMQLAALLLEKTTRQLSEAEAVKLVGRSGERVVELSGRPQASRAYRNAGRVRR